MFYSLFDIGSYNFLMLPGNVPLDEMHYAINRAYELQKLLKLLRPISMTLYAPNAAGNSPTLPNPLLSKEFSGPSHFSYIPVQSVPRT